MVIGKDVHHQQTQLPFIPPRKRQSNKKCAGSQLINVDHIVQRGKQSPTAIEESALVKSSSLLLKKSIDSLASSSCDLNAIRPLTRSNEHNLHELHHINSGRAPATTTTTAAIGDVVRTSTTMSSQQSKDTSSCYSADSISLMDAKSHDCLTSANKKRVNYKSDYGMMPSSSSSVQTTTEGSGHAHRHQQPQQHHHQQQYRSSPQSNDDLLLASGDTSSAATGGNDSCATTDGRQLSFSRYTNTIGSSARTESYLTMTGTVKRGRKKGQSVDLQINMSRDELEKINAAALVAVEETAAAAAVGCCQCTRSVGLHVLLLSLLCMPVVMIATGIYSFYIGTCTWYNMFNYLNEERSVWLRILVSPMLVLMYPLLIVMCTLGLGVYAGVVQLSLRFNSWLNEIGDVEKGFYGWLCAVLRMSDCSPYEVVVLVDLMAGDRLQPMNSSTEELSL